MGMPPGVFASCASRDGATGGDTAEDGDTADGEVADDKAADADAADANAADADRSEPRRVVADDCCTSPFLSFLGRSSSPMAARFP
jgi:hypothetical protein